MEEKNKGKKKKERKRKSKKNHKGFGQYIEKGLDPVAERMNE